jgi:hypothetical protein
MFTYTTADFQAGDRIVVGNVSDSDWDQDEQNALFNMVGTVIASDGPCVLVELDKAPVFFNSTRRASLSRTQLFLPSEIHKTYVCPRGACKSYPESVHYISDMTTHSQYHDRRDGRGN